MGARHWPLGARTRTPNPEPRIQNPNVWARLGVGLVVGKKKNATLTLRET